MSYMHSRFISHALNCLLVERSNFFKPNLTFVPKCFPAFTSEVLELSDFHPLPFSSMEDQRPNVFIRGLKSTFYSSESCRER